MTEQAVTDKDMTDDANAKPDEDEAVQIDGR